MNTEARAQMEQQKNEAGEMRIQYHDEPTRGARIKVIGVGGGGGNGGSGGSGGGGAAAQTSSSR